MRMHEEPISIDDLVKRRMVWDATPCSSAREMIRKVGLVPSSEAGYRVEHRASHVRINRLIPIEDELILYSGCAGEILGRAILENQGIEVGEGLSDPDLQHYIKVVHAGVVAVLANLVDEGIVSLNGAIA